MSTKTIYYLLVRQLKDKSFSEFDILSRPDVEKTKQDIRCEVEEEFRKNRTALSAGSN